MKHKKIEKQCDGTANDLYLNLIEVSTSAKVFIQTPDGEKPIKSVQIIPAALDEKITNEKIIINY